MQSNSRRTNSGSRWVLRLDGRILAGLALGGGLLLASCAHSPDQFRETGPSVTAQWDTPTAQDVRARVSPAEPHQRQWEPMVVHAADGAVTHWPLYFEDPFVDKGDGRTDETDPGNVHRLGWEDYVALPYSFGRYTINWIFLPVSAIVTPPWTLMESDGRLSKQLLGYDHDAIPVARAAELEGRTEPIGTPPSRVEPAPDQGFDVAAPGAPAATAPAQ